LDFADAEKDEKGGDGRSYLFRMVVAGEELAGGQRSSPSRCRLGKAETESEREEAGEEKKKVERRKKRNSQEVIGSGPAQTRDI
jgi:hypothetical protein